VYSLRGFVIFVAHRGAFHGWFWQVGDLPHAGSTCRNEANWRCKWLSWHGGWRFGNGHNRLGGLLRGRRGLEVLEDFEGAEVHAIGAVNAPLKAGKGIEGVLVGVAEGVIVLDGRVEEFGAGEVFVEAFDLVPPELGFDAAEAALGPLGKDEGVDERELVGAGGVVVEEKCRGEGLEFGGIFAGDDEGPSVDAGFERVEGGAGFAFGRGGARGFLGVKAIGVNLCFGRHSLKPRGR
jgi:hypothetical protein